VRVEAPESEVTILLATVKGGDQDALAELIPLFL
jgi:hypothetical protein